MPVISSAEYPSGMESDSVCLSFDRLILMTMDRPVRLALHPEVKGRDEGIGLLLLWPLNWSTVTRSASVLVLASVFFSNKASLRAASASTSLVQNDARESIDRRSGIVVL